MAIASRRLHRNRQGRARAMSTTPDSGSGREIEREVERAKSDAAELASSAAETAKRKAQEAADRARGRTADRAEELAAALDSTAEDLETSAGGEMISGYGRSMAELMRRFADGLREQEIEEFAGQLADFARRNPASFFAGSVALGFGMARFLKASSTRSLEEYGYEDEDELLLDEEDEFDFDEMDTEASGADYEAAPGTDDGRASPAERGTSGASPSPRYGNTDAERWPEDRGRERQGAGSYSDHWRADDEGSASSSGP